MARPWVNLCHRARGRSWLSNVLVSKPSRWGPARQRATLVGQIVLRAHTRQLESHAASAAITVDAEIRRYSAAWQTGCAIFEVEQDLPWCTDRENLAALR